MPRSGRQPGEVSPCGPVCSGHCGEAVGSDVLFPVQRRMWFRFFGGAGVVS